MTGTKDVNFQEPEPFRWPTTERVEMNDQQGLNTPLSRIVDVKIPMWGLMCVAATGAFFLISMYFSTNKLVEDVADLKLTVKAFNTQVTTLAGDQALLRFRLENVEGDLRAIKSALSGNVAGNVPTQPRYPDPNGRRTLQ